MKLQKVEKMSLEYWGQLLPIGANCQLFSSWFHLVATKIFFFAWPFFFVVLNGFKPKKKIFLKVKFCYGSTFGG